MKILIIGNGSREHAISLKLRQSDRVTEIYNVGPGLNAGLNETCDQCFDLDSSDPVAVSKVAKQIQPDLAIIGPEDPIAKGVSDALKNLGIPTFAPDSDQAQLESSKSFTRDLLTKYEIDASPAYQVVTAEDDFGLVKQFYDQQSGQIVVKADGLLGGKGVLVADDHFTELSEAADFAKLSIEKFGRVVLEEKMVGPEFSLISIVDGETVLDCPVIQDYKRVGVDGTGPNTGGMGTISHASGLLPGICNQADKNAAHDITVQVMKALNDHFQKPFQGVMYGGFMRTAKGVKLIEYNIRFGDPECLNIMNLLENDLVEICERTINGTLSELGELKFKPVSTVCKYLCANGYPASPVKGVLIEPITINDNKVQVIYGAQINSNGDMVTKGSREIGLITQAAEINEAAQLINELAQQVAGPLFYRPDIGLKN